MNRSHASMIAGLSAELAPVRPLHPRLGLASSACALGLTVLGVALVEGLWPNGMGGRAEAVFYIVNLLLLILGVAVSSAVVRMASPGVGNRYDGPWWALAMLAVLPLATIISLAAEGRLAAIGADRHGPECMIAGLGCSVLIAAVLVRWLRRGAPAVPHRAGLLVGIAAGALGSLAHGLACPIDNLGHLAIWHVLPVAIGGLAGRYVLAPLLRW